MVTAGAEAEVFEEDSSLDVENAIAEFLKDPSRSSLKLPHMTTGQRRHAKQLVANHPELKCESYGMGSDRSLHLFKKSSPLGKLAELGSSQAAHPSGAVNVKNTFIDDWVPAEGEGASEPVVFRSMPLQAGGKSPIVESILEAGPRHADFCMNEKHSIAAEGNPPPLPGGKLVELSGKGRELPRLPEELRPEVRNTFLHIEGDHSSVDERVVQSMPHGMFRSQLEAESEQSLATALEKEPMNSTEGPPPPPAHAPDFAGPGIAASVSNLLTPGTPIMVEGLVKAPAFNGLSGVVQFYEEDTGRYSVLLSSPGHPSGVQWAKIKGGNLRLTMPPCPPYSAMPPEVHDAFASPQAPPPLHHAMSGVQASAAAAVDVGPLGVAATPLRLTALV